MEHLLDPLRQSPSAVAIPDMVREWKGIGESMLKSLVDCASDIESREKKIAAARESLEERLKDLLEREKAYESSNERERSRERELDERLKSVSEHIQRLETEQSELNVMRMLECEKLKAIDKREKTIEQREMDFNLFKDEIVSKEEVLSKEREGLSEKLKAIEKREKTIQQRERDFYSSIDEKLRVVKTREEVLSREREGLAEKQKAIEKREKTIQQKERDFNLSKDEKQREIVSREEVMRREREGLAEKQKAIEKREKTIEQREKDFNLSKDEKLREIVSKDEVLSRGREEFRGVVERFHSGFILFEGLKDKAGEKLKSLNAEAEKIRVSLEKRIEEVEKEIVSVQEDKMQELESKERELSNILKEIETREVSVSAREKEVIVSSELENVRLQELEDMEKKFKKYKERKMGELKFAEEKLRLVGKGFIQEVNLREENFDAQEKKIHGLLERLELARKNISDMNALVSERFKKTGFKETGVKLDEDVALSEEKELVVTKNECQLNEFEKDLEMLINDTEKDLEVIGSGVFVVLFLCSDPAKLVLDAITRFCVPCLGKGDVEVNVWRKGVVLLDQLTKMSPSIQPCVMEGAIKVAFEWKAKMKSGNNSLEVLGFLHLLAAYNLKFRFSPGELLSYLNLVAQEKQVPELCRTLVPAEIPGFIQSLINEKRYLLASTYIHECGLESVFPQAAVLNYHVEHLKAKRKRENTSPEALDQAFANEIADLRLAVEHVMKYGLDSACSPNVLTKRIKTLEMNRADAKRQAQVRAARIASSPAWFPDNRSSPGWKARNCQSKQMAPTNCYEVPMTHSNESNMISKRRKLAREWVAPNKCARQDTVVRVTN